MSNRDSEQDLEKKLVDNNPAKTEKKSWKKQADRAENKNYGLVETKKGFGNLKTEKEKVANARRQSVALDVISAFKKMVEIDEIFEYILKRSKLNEQIMQLEKDNVNQFVVPPDFKQSASKSLHQSVGFRSYQNKLNKIRELHIKVKSIFAQYQDNDEDLEEHSQYFLDSLKIHIKYEYSSKDAENFFKKQNISSPDDQLAANVKVEQEKVKNYFETFKEQVDQFEDRQTNEGGKKSKVNAKKQILDHLGFEDNRTELAKITSFFISTNELAFLGTGYPWYFHMLELCICILIAMFVLSGLSNMMVNLLYGDDCKSSSETKGCTQNWYNDFSLGNIKNKPQLIDVLQMQVAATCVMLMCLFQWFRSRHRQVTNEIDSLQITPDDFSLRIEGLPKVLDRKMLRFQYEDEHFEHKGQKLEGHKLQIQLLKLIIKEKFEQRSIRCDVKDVLFLKNYKEVLATIEERDELVKDKIALMKKQGNSGDEKDKTITEEMKDIEENIKGMNRKIEDQLEERVEDNCGKAIISVMTESQKERMLEMHNKITGGHVSIEKKPLSITQARPPKQIFWPNQWLTYAERRRNKVKSYTLGVFLLLVVFGITFGILAATKETEYGSTVNSVLITLLNFFIANMIQKIAKEAKSIDRTDYQAMVITWNTAIQFFNSGLSTLIVSLIFTVIKDGLDTPFYDVLYNSHGFAMAQTDIFISNVWLTFLLNLGNLGYLFKSAERYLVERDDKKEKTIYMTQKAADELYLDPEFTLENEYSSMIKTMFITAFYSIMIPFSMALSIVALIGIYISGKFNLLRKSCVRYDYSPQLGQIILELLEYLIPLYGLSAVVFIFLTTNSFTDDDGKKVKTKFDYLAYFVVAVTLLHAWLPMQKVNEKLFDVSPAINAELNYEQAKVSWDKSETYEGALYQYFGQEKNMIGVNNEMTSQNRMNESLDREDTQDLKNFYQSKYQGKK